MNLNDIERFKNREVKAKELFKIKEINKQEAYDFVKQYHYLGDAKFFTMYSYGMFNKDELVGVATYSILQGIHALEGWFGLKCNDTSVLELSRLCLLPELNNTNATSYLLGNSMRIMHNTYKTRAVTTLADSSRHIGSIYQVCNFKYYGLTAKKTEFYSYDNGGKIIQRGDWSKLRGVWLPRTRKHRYAYIFDKTLVCLHKEQPHPTQKNTISVECCQGTKKVIDNRNGITYTCPKCCGYMHIINNGIEEKTETNPLKIALMRKKLYQSR